MFKENIGTFNFYLHIYEAFKDAILGAGGGSIAYIYEYRANNYTGWNTIALVLNILVGGFLAQIMGKYISSDTPWRDAIIAGIGIMAFGIITVAKTKLSQILMTIIQKS